MSALEGLDGPPQDLTLIGHTTHIERHDGAVTFDGNRVRTDHVDASIDASGRFYWIRAPKVLSYHSATGRTTLLNRDAFGLLEHAWGAQTRIDVARLVPRRWQWDVLSLGDTRFFAGLAIHGIGVRGAARLEGRESLSRVHSIRIHRGAPDHWRGVMHTHRGILRYEARASTPVAREVPGGGFFGFTWEGTLDDANLSGAGFSEYRDTRSSRMGHPGLKSGAGREH